MRRTLYKAAPEDVDNEADAEDRGNLIGCGRRLLCWVKDRFVVGYAARGFPQYRIRPIASGFSSVRARHTSGVSRPRNHGIAEKRRDSGYR